MHTLLMRLAPTRTGRSNTRSLVALALAGALALSGCSGGGEPTGTKTTSGSPSAPVSSPAYLDVPEGVTLTAQGGQLAVGDHAVVAYEPRQGEVGVLDLRVTKLEKTTFKRSFAGWKLDKATKQATPYFVHVTVANVGDTDLGGRRVPLYIVDGTNTLIESSTFASTFKPCPSDPLPATFDNGARAKVCLVYLSPERGELTAVSFRPTQEFDPITWTGPVTKVAIPKPPKAKKGKNSKKSR